jgi:hypothetical protein
MLRFTDAMLHNKELQEKIGFREREEQFMRKFFIDRVQEESVLSGHAFMYLHYADMIANGYHRTMPCPFQRQGLLLNPNGELVNFTIVESKAGLARVREIAAVKGIGVLFPGAGTLRGVFTTTDANGQRVFDEKGWEAAIQQVLAACREFNGACGYPATATDIEMRMQQGFSMFIINWGEQGFKAVDIGRKAGGRAADGMGQR